MADKNTLGDNNDFPLRLSHKEWAKYKKTLPTFFSLLDNSERKKLLKYEEFRNYLIEEGTAFTEFIKYLEKEDCFLLLDGNFVDELFSNEISTKLAYAVLSKIKNGSIRDEIVSKYKYVILTNPKNLTQIMSTFESLSYETRFDILSDFVKNKTIDMGLLANFLRAIYPVRYVYVEELDYSKNEKVIAKVSELLSDSEIRKVIYNDYSLLSELDPANRSILYLNKKYNKMTDAEKQNLFKLLEKGVDTTLNEGILFDGNFIEDVASIEQVSEYKSVLRSLENNNPRVVETIKERRTKFYDYYLDKFKEESLETFTSSTSKSIASHIPDYIFDKYFEACSTDSLYSACVVIDAMDMPGFEKHLTKEGRQVIEELKRLLINVAKRNKYVSYLNKVVEKKDVVLIDELKELCDLMDKIPDFAKKFVSLMKTARKTFEEQVRNSIGKVKVRKMENKDGARVYEIDYNSPFLMLVHSREIKDEVRKELIMQAIPKSKEKPKPNVSMSLLDNDHLMTYGDKKFDRFVNLGYTKIDENTLKHAYLKDSFTDHVLTSGAVKRLDNAVSAYPPTYIDLQSFMNLTINNDYNELKFQTQANAIDNEGNSVMKPDYILCKDNITELDLIVSKRYNIPIVYMDTKKIKHIASTQIYKPTLYRAYQTLDNLEYKEITNPLVT